jgi:vancomycin permeability regulator SanA
MDEIITKFLADKFRFANSKRSFSFALYLFLAVAVTALLPDKLCSFSHNGNIFLT